MGIWDLVYEYLGFGIWVFGIWYMSIWYLVYEYLGMEGLLFRGFFTVITRCFAMLYPHF